MDNEELTEEEETAIIREAEKVTNESEKTSKSKKDKSPQDDGIKWEIFNNETDDDRNW